MRKHISYTIITIAILQATIGFAQKREGDTIRTGVIDVVKPYTPSISDAFKVKEKPNFENDETLQKKEIEYNIFSIPVASTFTPAKGKAAKVEKEKPQKLYDNYATLGVGSFTTIAGELYINKAISRSERIGGYISHNSSSGDVEGVLLDSGFSNSKLNANYSSQLRHLSWNAEAGFQFLTYNWYGLAPNFATDADFANTLDVGHAFYSAYLAGDLNFEDTYINSGSLEVRRFGDNQGSAEHSALIKSKVDFPINRREEIATDFRLDYLGGAFDRGFFSENELKYSNVIAGGSPSYQILKDDVTVDLGASIYYLHGITNVQSKLLVYPNVKASYRLVNDVLVLYGGVTGDVIQNSYRNFAKVNPFVSPTLQVAPTDQKYNAYVGLKGKVSSTTSYTVSGRYISDNNKALFRNNVTLLDSFNAQDYQFGNSFGVVYDNLNTIQLSGELNVDLNRDFTMTLKASYFNYSTDIQDEAWNLPDIEGALFLDYQINDHWYADANVFFVGQRKDRLAVLGQFGDFTTSTVNLDSFFDANARAGYHVNDQISIFTKINNITGNSYQRWQNFPVQSLQFLVGATLKFDF